MLVIPLPPFFVAFTHITQVRRLLSFLGLPNHAPCATPERTGAVITTPSQVALRRPLAEQGARSRGGWERYASVLEELLYAHADAKRWTTVYTGSGAEKGVGAAAAMADAGGEGDGEEGGGAASGSVSARRSDKPGQAMATATAVRLLAQIEAANEARRNAQEEAEAEAEAAAEVLSQGAGA